MKGESAFFVLTHEQDFRALYDHLKAHGRAAAERGEPLSVEVLAFEKKRTAAQIRFYRVILKQVSEKVATGRRLVPPDTWDLYFKQEILGSAELHTPTGSADFQKYVEEVKVLAAELGAVLELEDRL